MRMMLFVAALCAFVAVPAMANFNWQTQPILGTSASDVTGDVVVITGPTPVKPGGGFYYDVDGNVVLGPTIPHYSTVGDPLFGIGSPSMTQFVINPTVWSGTHWYDPTVSVYSGSGVYLDPLATYHYTGTYSFLGTPGNPAYDLLVAENASFSEDSGFIMLITGVGDFWLEDVGSWKYTETWMDNATLQSITSIRPFEVVAVPVPGAVLLGLLGLSAAGVKLRKQRVN
jgi:hypothetical protein